MKVLFEQRASTIIYNLIKCNGAKGVAIIPANVCPIVVAVFLKAGVKFELIDICPTTLCLSKKEVLGKLKRHPNKYSSVLFVRSYGTQTNFDDFFMDMKEAQSDLFVIDDRCISIPSLKMEEIGHCDVVLFSTGYSKYVDLGWGAFAYAKDSINYIQNHLYFEQKAIDDLMTSFKNTIEGRDGFDFSLIESNWLDTSKPEVSFADYLSIVSSKLIESSILKERINKKLRLELPKSYQFADEFQHWRFNIFVPEKRILLAEIFKSDLFASSHFVPSSRIFYKEKREVSDDISGNVINLFSDGLLPYEKLDQLVAIINEHWNKFGLL